MESYALSSMKNFRYIKNWGVYGIKNEEKYLLDIREDYPLCPGRGCKNDVTVVFGSKNPGMFRKFMIQSTGFDSQNDYYLSLQYLKFYGKVISHIVSFTSNLRMNLFICLLILLLTWMTK